MKLLKAVLFSLCTVVLLVPTVLGANVSYKTHTPPSSPYQHFLYLDGLTVEEGRIKTYPSKYGRTNANWRDWQSPIRNSSIPQGYYPAFSSVSMAEEHLDTTALNSLNLPQGMNITLINIKRNQNGKPYYRYFSNESNPDDYESWSASKFMLVPAAAAKIREKSRNKVGLDSTTNTGEHVGELVTYLHNYEAHGNYESNALARYFLDVAGRDWANSLVEKWIGSLDSSLGANYGAFYSDVGQNFYNDDHQIYVDNSSSYGGPDKKITTLASAEFLKRLVMHREDAVTRLPGFRAPKDSQKFWEDLKFLFYGQPNWYWGGMQDDSAIYLENSVDIDRIDRNTKGNWRIFSKLGYGTSSSRYKQEFVYTAYGCFPQPESTNPGAEFVISVHYSRSTGAIGGIQMDKNMQSSIKKVVQAIMNNQIDHLAAPVNTSQQLADIQGHWAETEIKALVKKGVLTGYGDGTFRPDRHLTRAEFATMIAGSFTLNQSRNVYFSDIDNHWAKDHILKVANSGFLSGYQDSTFRPDRKITKLEVIAALSADLNSNSTSNISLSQKYNDAYKIPQWGEQAVARATEAGIITNYPLAQYLEPYAQATRAEVAKYIYEMLERKGKLN